MKKLPLNLIYLKYFFDSVRFESISDAAKVNFVSQSAVSQAIAKLEESLGCELISHRPNRFKMTEKGERLFISAREILQTVQQAEDLLLEDDGGTITIGCTHSFSLTLLPIFLKEAKRRYPTLKIRFCLGHFHGIREWLKKRTIDFAILVDNEDLSQFDLEEIYRGEFRLYKADNCEEEDLSFLLDSDERRETVLLKNWYRSRFKRELPVQMEISSWGVIANLTEHGLGIGFFPDYLARIQHTSLKLSSYELDPIPYKLYALFLKNVPQNRHVLSFLEILTDRSLLSPPCLV